MLGYKGRAWYCFILSFFSFCAAAFFAEEPDEFGFIMLRASIVALVLIFWCMAFWPPPPKE